MLKQHGELRAFDALSTTSSFRSDANAASAQCLSGKDAIREYNLDRAQLAFTIGKKTTSSDRFPLMIYVHTTIYSEEIVEKFRKPSDDPHQVQSLCTQVSRSSTDCQMYKYAPRSGSASGNEEVLIVFDNTLRPDKYGGEFEYIGRDENVEWRLSCNRPARVIRMRHSQRTLDSTGSGCRSARPSRVVQ